MVILGRWPLWGGDVLVKTGMVKRDNEVKTCGKNVPFQRERQVQSPWDKVSLFKWEKEDWQNYNFMKEVRNWIWEVFGTSSCPGHNEEFGFYPTWTGKAPGLDFWEGKREASKRSKAFLCQSHNFTCIHLCVSWSWSWVLRPFIWVPPIFFWFSVKIIG